MHSSSILLSLTLIALVSASPYYPRANSNSTQASCVGAGAVHMIVARASTENPGEGIIGAVATMVKAALPGSDSEAVVYPATLTDYQASESSGVSAMTKLVQDYAAMCPDSKIAVMGYSQGAQVAADVLCGTSEIGFPTNSSSTTPSPLSASVSEKIVAMVLMGDPSHVPTDTFNAGTSKNNGVFPRKNSAACPTAKTVSYCDDMDKFCDSGSSVEVHISYVKTYGSAAAKFITDKVSGNSTTSSTVASSSGSGTPKAITMADAEDITRGSMIAEGKSGEDWEMVAATLGMGIMV